MEVSSIVICWEGNPFYEGHNVDLTIVDGIAYVSAVDGVVSALRISDGALLWHYRTDGSVDGPPLVVNGAVYVSANVDKGAGHLYALRADDGTLLWRYATDNYVLMQRHHLCLASQ